jgi:integrase
MTRVHVYAPAGPRRPIDLTKFQYEKPGHYTLHDCFCDYSRQKLINKGKDCLRPWIGFNNLFEVVPPHQDPTKLEAAQIEDFTDLRVAQGRSVMTVRRELVFVKAAIKHAHRRNHIKLLPHIELPEGQSMDRIPLSEEQFQVVIAQPMSPRLFKFYMTAYYTGHRSVAIEELRWDRTNLDRGLLDFNVPGRPINNKRRNGAFTVQAEFLEMLRQWHSEAADPYVIGAGSTTYHEAAYVVRKLCGFIDPHLVPRHCMRSMFATELFEAGADPEVVGKLIGDNPQTLRRRYVKFKESTMRNVAELRARRIVAAHPQLAAPHAVIDVTAFSSVVE